MPSNLTLDKISGRRWWLLITGGVLIILMALLVPRRDRTPVVTSGSPNTASSNEAADALEPRRAKPFARSSSSSIVAAPPAEEIVTNKLNRFVRSRRELVHAMARRQSIEVPDDVERFFDAVEAGRWDEMHALYEAMSARKRQEPPDQVLMALGHPLLETLGVAEAVQKWPAQRLLDYGNGILDALKPGMVYVGGTDPGRYIPTLLNETSDGERHIVLTQNAFADRTYLDYAKFLYDDRLASLTTEDSDRAFSDYMTDAQKRFQHDRDFPNEPKQVRPGEDIRFIDNRTQVSGQVAVMAINERLLQMLMDKNPDASFAIQQSMPFTSMFGDARPLGPLMELRASAEQGTLTPESAGATVEYWRAAQQMYSGVETTAETAGRSAFAKLAADQAALLLHHGFTAEAEQTLRAATEIAPASGEAVFRYVNVLVEQKRFDAALRVTEAAVRADRDEQHQFGALVEELNRLKTQRLGQND